MANRQEAETGAAQTGASGPSPGSELKEIIVRYRARRRDGTLGHFRIRFDARKKDFTALVWDRKTLEMLLRCSERSAVPFELPPVEKDDEKTDPLNPEPEPTDPPPGTCVWKDGRWSCP